MSGRGGVGAEGREEAPIRVFTEANADAIPDLILYEGKLAFSNSVVTNLGTGSVSVLTTGPEGDGNPTPD